MKIRNNKKNIPCAHESNIMRQKRRGREKDKKKKREREKKC